MLRQTLRRLGPVVAAAEPTAYTIGLSKAQGVAKGLTGGTTHKRSVRK